MKRLEGIKVYCFTCRQFILKTSENFVAVPLKDYDGTMFQPRGDQRSIPAYLPFTTAMRGGQSLMCPKCSGHFIRPTGEILSEHGIIKPGQRRINREKYIVHTEGPRAGALFCFDYSEEPAGPRPNFAAGETPRPGPKLPPAGRAMPKRPKPEEIKTPPPPAPPAPSVDTTKANAGATGMFNVSSGPSTKEDKEKARKEKAAKKARDRRAAQKKAAQAQG